MPHIEPPSPHYSYPPLPKKNAAAVAPYEYQEFPRGIHNASDAATATVEPPAAAIRLALQPTA